MVGTLVPRENMATMKHTVASSNSMCNRSIRAAVANSRVKLQIRKRVCYQRSQVGVRDNLPKSLRISVGKPRFRKLHSFGSHDMGQSAGSKSGMLLSGNMNYSKYSTRAEYKSAEFRLNEPKSWLPASFKIPKQMRFWEENEHSKREEAAQKPVVPQKNEYTDFEEELLFKEHTVDAQTSRGYLSPAAINVIEQFSRLNGVTGKKMRADFEATASTYVQNDARNLVEFCVFRYLVRSDADFHPSLSDAAFRRLTFTAMLAWQRPYQEDLRSINNGSKRSKPPRGLVGEEAFIRIASSISGAADRVTAHSLYKVLTHDMKGLSFEVWDTYIQELCGVLDERKNYQQMEASTLGLEPDEEVLSVGQNKRQPVQKWNGTMVWPGRLTLTNRALYFEANSLTSHQAPVRLDLTRGDAVIDNRRVGPLGAELFDSAISIASSPDSEPWILEFVNFGGEKRRDIWLAIIKEIVLAHWFIREYGPRDNDPSLNYMDGSVLGSKRALASASNGIARLQAVQHALGHSPDDSRSLLQFCSTKDAPSAELVFEALAVTNWAGRVDSKAKELSASNGAEEEQVGTGQNVVSEDGSIYLSKWMTSQTWDSIKSQNFWKAHKGGSKGLVLGKNFSVGGLTNLDRAVGEWREQSRVVDKTKATIDGAKLKGIPNNVDLLKELLLPFSIIATNVQKLKRWEEPGATAGFLIAALGVVYMNWLRYVFPTILLTCAGILCVLRGLKAQGRLTDDFGKLTIRDQPETNTIQKIMALKDALTSLEDFLQNTNIALLKLRSVALSRDLHSTNEVLWSLLGAGIVTWFVPFRYLLAGVLIDQFTAELPFRRKSVEEFFNRVNDWWSMIPATPVEVLPPEKTSNTTDAHLPEESSDGPNQGEAVMQALSEWLGDEE
ncbi:uncharacterized protein [Physcomitrium patens]|uniref:Uncharacterized protein n=1 Tax=Physcomitrium patens TaxID=3218 RepID=A0A2K1JI15_PHYPA|nr:uncharacterized protein LOC112291899 [Physcomitrium patens]XP_024395638.1 uncharacterized protein LOC112291899 [Physcomitrium patens]PNR41200.1 hypothetical protein PHYPA_018603 [Physcomitrium patens]|eukprot:XP_024395636.1 uncharacterized protein LOC112291899 [Physcomitrella patens]